MQYEGELVGFVVGKNEENNQKLNELVKHKPTVIVKQKEDKIVNFFAEMSRTIFIEMLLFAALDYLAVKNILDLESVNLRDGINYLASLVATIRILPFVPILTPLFGYFKKNPENLFKLVGSVSGYMLTLAAMYWLLDQYETTITIEAFRDMFKVQMFLTLACVAVMVVYIFSKDILSHKENRE